MRLFFFFLIFSLVTPFPGALHASPNLQEEAAQAAFDEALRLKAEGNFAEAERYFTKALEMSPARPSYRFELANLYAERYDRLRTTGSAEARELLERAERELEQTVMMDPNFIAARYNLGVVQKRLGKFEQARDEFRQVLLLEPRAVNAQMQLGATYEEQGFFLEARDAYRTAQSMNATNPDIETALHDLDKHEEEARRRMRAETQPGMGLLGSNFNYSPNSYARQYEAARQGDTQANQGLQQAIPYIGAMLVQELMKIRSQNREEGT